MVRELAVGDREMYFRYMRMTTDRKEHLFSKDVPHINKLSTNYKEPISPELRLSLTLRHLVQENLKSPLVCIIALDDKQFQN